MPPRRTPAQAASLAALQLAPALAAGTLPVDVLQGLFALQGAEAVAARYRSFPALDPQSERARMFVALEDWLSDGVPLAGPAAAECIGGWYGENTPAKGQWHVGGAPVDPATLRVPDPGGLAGAGPHRAPWQALRRWPGLFPVRPCCARMAATSGWSRVRGRAQRYGSRCWTGCGNPDRLCLWAKHGSPAMSASATNDIVIVAAARTPVGSFNGAFGSRSCPCLGHRRPVGRHGSAPSWSRVRWTR